MAKLLLATVLFAVVFAFLVLEVAPQDTAALKLCTRDSKSMQGHCNNNEKCDEACINEKTSGGFCKDETPPVFDQTKFAKCIEEQSPTALKSCQEHISSLLSTDAFLRCLRTNRVLDAEELIEDCKFDITGIFPQGRQRCTCTYLC